LGKIFLLVAIIPTVVGDTRLRLQGLRNSLNSRWGGDLTQPNKSNLRHFQRCEGMVNSSEAIDILGTTGSRKGLKLNFAHNQIFPYFDW